AEMAQQFERMGADAIELNLGCPNRGIMVGRSASETMGRYWSETPERAFRVVSAVKEAVIIPVWAKFPYEIVFPKPEVTRQMAEAGADGLDFYASVPMGMAINLETGRPVLGNPRGTGIVSGHGMKPLGVRCTVELCRRLPVPVIASGGVFGGLDVIEYIMAGAHAVGVMTGIMQKVHARDIVTEAEQFLSAAGYQSLADIRGKVLQFLPED
ncbi:MAG: tRNA-dihydrouridine synthase, partial [Chloroflexota bacterium]